VSFNVTNFSDVTCIAFRFSTWHRSVQDRMVRICVPKLHRYLLIDFFIPANLLSRTGDMSSILIPTAVHTYSVFCFILHNKRVSCTTFEHISANFDGNIVNKISVCLFYLQKRL